MATLPVGYADGVRCLQARNRGPAGRPPLPDRGCDHHGPARRRLRAAREAPRPQVGAEAVLIGEQGADRVTAEDWAGRLGTIAYEIICGIGPRIPRIYG